MRACYIIFEDDEFEKLNKIRRKMTWRRWVLKMAGLPYEIKPFVNPGKYYKQFKFRVRK